MGEIWKRIFMLKTFFFTNNDQNAEDLDNIPIIRMKLN
jgi:hypothetical protein